MSPGGVPPRGAQALVKRSQSLEKTW